MTVYARAVPLRRLLTVLVIALALLPFAPLPTAQAASAVWTVSTTKDTTTPAAAHCSAGACPTLRDALTAATGGDTISLAAISGIITTTSPLSVTTSVSITGPLTTTLVLNGNGAHTVLAVASGVTATISGLTVDGGLGSITSTTGHAQVAGGIYNQGNLTLTHVVVTGNTSSGPGGGIYSDGYQGTAVLTLTSSTVSNNTSSGNGGGIASEGAGPGSATLALTGTSVLSNTTAYYGGGIENRGTATILNSTLASNRATGLPASGIPGPVVGHGGGIYSTGPLTITGSTVRGNATAGVSTDPSSLHPEGFQLGGGIASDGPLVVTTSTFTGNTSGEGGGLFTSAQAAVAGSTFTSNSAGAGGAIGSSGALAITGTTIVSNSAAAGGGLFSHALGGLLDSAQSLSLANSTVMSNTTSSDGGGIEAMGQVAITGSAILSNTVHCTSPTGSEGAGGGIVLNDGGAMTITDSTLAGNTVQGITFVSDGDGNYESDCGAGSAIELVRSAALTLTATTVANNPGQSALYSEWPCCGAAPAGATVQLNLTNDIITGDNANGGQSCDFRGAPNPAQLVDSGGNVFGDSSCVPLPTRGGAGGTGSTGGTGGTGSTGSTGGAGGAGGVPTGPRLGSLGNYGGPTLTINLLSGSSALGHGVAAGCAANGGKDQRGVTRPATACDSGSWQH